MADEIIVDLSARDRVDFHPDTIALCNALSHCVCNRLRRCIISCISPRSLRWLYRSLARIISDPEVPNGTAMSFSRAGLSAISNADNDTLAHLFDEECDRFENAPLKTQSKRLRAISNVVVVDLKKDNRPLNPEIQGHDGSPVSEFASVLSSYQGYSKNEVARICATFFRRREGHQDTLCELLFNKVRSYHPDRVKVMLNTFRRQKKTILASVHLKKNVGIFIEARLEAILTAAIRRYSRDQKLLADAKRHYGLEMQAGDDDDDYETGMPKFDLGDLFDRVSESIKGVLASAGLDLAAPANSGLLRKTIAFLRLCQKIIQMPSTLNIGDALIDFGLHFIEDNISSTLKAFAALLGAYLVKKFAFDTHAGTEINPVMQAGEDDDGSREENIVAIMIKSIVYCFIPGENAQSVILQSRRIKKIKEISILIRSLATIKDFCVTLICRVWEYVADFFGLNSPSQKKLDEIDGQIGKWFKKFKVVTSRKPEVPVDTQLSEDIDVAREIVELYQEGERVLNNTYGFEGLKNPSIMRIFMNQFARVMKWNHAAQMRLSTGHIRNTPLCFYLWGPPGIGKSFMIDYLVSDLYKEARKHDAGIPLFEPHRHRFIRNPASPFWEQYHNQRLTSFNDFFQSKNEESRFREIDEVIHAVQTAPYSLNMAFEQKGSTFFNSSILSIDSNEQPSQALFDGFMTDPRALLRRLHYIIHPVLKDEYRNDFGGFRRPDGNDELFISEAYEFHVSGSHVGTRAVWSYRELIQNMYKTWNDMWNQDKRKIMKWHEDFRDFNGPIPDEATMVAPPTQSEPAAEAAGIYFPSAQEQERTKKRLAEMMVATEEARNPRRKKKKSLNIDKDLREYDTRVKKKLTELTDLLEGEMPLEAEPQSLLSIAGCYTFLMLLQVVVTALFRGLFRYAYNRVVTAWLLGSILPRRAYNDFITWEAQQMINLAAGVSFFDKTRAKAFGIAASCIAGIFAVYRIHGSWRGVSKDVVYAEMQGDSTKSDNHKKNLREYRPRDLAGKTINYQVAAVMQTGPSEVKEVEVEADLEDDSIPPVPDFHADLHTTLVKTDWRERAQANSTNIEEFGINSLARNIVRIGRDDKDTCRFAATNGVMVRGTICVVPAHFLAFWEDVPVLNVTVSNGFSSWKFTKEQLTIHTDDDFRDFALIFFPKTLPPFRNITKHFLKGTDIGRVKGRDGTLYGTNFDSRHVAGRLSKVIPVKCITGAENRKVVNADYKEIVEFPRIVSYSTKTLPGDCGSALLLDDPAYPPTIVGIHSIGDFDKNYGAATIVTQDDIYNIIALVAKSDPILRTTMMSPQCATVDVAHTYSKFEPFDTPGVSLDVIGKVAAKWSPNYPHRTNLRSSCFAGIYPPQTAPAKLRVDDPNPLEKVARAMTDARAEVPSQHVIQATELVSYDVAKLESRAKYDRRLLTWHESYFGVEGDPYLRRINERTSPGTPWRQIFHGTGKRAIVDVDNETLLPDLLDYLDYAEQMMLACDTLPVVIFSDTLKDERRPLSKVEEGSTRIFSVGPLPFNMLLRRYFGIFISHLHENCARGPVAVGINPYGTDWDFLYARLSEQGTEAIMGDYSKWDKMLPYSLMMGVADVANHFYDDGPDNARVRVGLLQLGASAYRVMGNVLYREYKGVPSGWSHTSEFNSIANYILTTTAIIDLCTSQPESRIPASRVLDHFQTTFYGDDHVIVVSDHMAQYVNMVTFARKMKDYGIGYTNPDKKGEIHRCTVSDMLYLKRTFVQCPYTFKLRCPIDITVPRESIQWYHRSKENVGDIVQSTLRSAMIEFFHHGRKVFNRERAAIMAHPGWRYCGDHFGVTLSLPTYDELLAMGPTIGDFYVL